MAKKQNDYPKIIFSRKRKNNVKKSIEKVVNKKEQTAILKLNDKKVYYFDNNNNIKITTETLFNNQIELINEQKKSINENLDLKSEFSDSQSFIN